MQPCGTYTVDVIILLSHVRVLPDARSGAQGTYEVVKNFLQDY